MRIAILAPHAGYIVGGVETATRALRKHLLGQHECDIFSLAETSWTTKVPGFKGPKSPWLIRKLRLNYLNHLLPYVYILKPYAFSEFFYCYHIYPILKKYKPDIILNFTYSILALFGKYFRHKTGVPFVNVGQSGCNHMEVKSARTKPDVYVALTPVAKNYIEQRVPGVRVEVIPNGVDLELFRSEGPRYTFDQHKAESDLTPPYFLSTSRLVGEKRLDLLIKAVSRLKQGTLILVGRGEAKKRLSKLGEELLKNRIVFIDTLSQQELATLYRACDVFSLPSKREAFGNVVVEAMASGLPGVVTDDEGFRWMVGKEGGILVDVTDTEAYAAALEEACERDFGDGPSRQARRFSWKIVTQDYIDLCTSILEDRE